MPRGRPRKPPEERAPRRSGKGGVAPAETDQQRVQAVAERLLVLRRAVTARRHELGMAAVALGQPCTWAQLAQAEGRKSPGDLSLWASGKRRVTEATLARLERAVRSWCMGEDEPPDTLGAGAP